MTIQKLDQAFRKFRFTLKFSGWLPAAVGALVVGGFLAIYDISHAESSYLRRIVEVIIPLAFGLHAAFVFAPESEPAIELLLSYPKSLTRHMRERLAFIGLLHGSVAILSTLLIAVIWNIESVWLALIRWLAAGIFLGGVAVLTTQLARQTAFGALLTTLIWASSLYGGDALMKAWPWIWPAHIYLQPENVSSSIYLLNRGILFLVGLALMALAALLLRDDERSLGKK